MEDVWIRFWSALVYTVLSVMAFYLGDWMIFAWWLGAYNLIMTDLMQVTQSYSISTVSSVLISNLFFFEFTIRPFNLQIEILTAIAFVPMMVSVLDPNRDFKAVIVMTTSYLWVTYPCVIGFGLSSQPSFMIGFLNLVWFTDAGAYFCGKLFGRTPLLQQISPKKSWEGTLGAIVTAQIVGYIVSIYVTNIAYQHWVCISLIASITGQIGDLFESFFKRHFNVKDSGHIMPGHGGMLDRFDAVLFALVFVRAYLVLVGIKIIA